MAEDFLEEIYKEARLYTELFEIRELARKDVTELVLDGIKKLYPRLGELGQHYINEDPELGTAFWKLLEKMSMYTGDNIWLTDFMDFELLPSLEKYLQRHSEISVEDEEGICIESSGHGFLTLKDLQHGNYFHSQIDPMQEAREQVLGFYRPEIREYAFLGCGLGYLAYQLYRISDGSVKIHLFECEERMIMYGQQYGVLEWIPEECLEITIGTDLLPFLQCAEKNGHDWRVFKPEIGFWPAQAQDIIKRLYTNQCTTSAFSRQNEINFFYNFNSPAKPISDAKYAWMDGEKKYIIVAGGPSVDDHIEYLKSQMGKVPILAVGTVFRKLVQAGIRPDLVVIMDPLPFVEAQLRDLWNEKVPLVVSATAYWKCCALYQGEKYLAPVLTGRCEPANQYAESVAGGWECGGTVTIMAVRAALYWGAKEIYLCGADFSYPNGYTHALGTNSRIQKDVSKLIPVESVGGDIVYTEETMNTYRQRLEELIESEKAVNFINLSHVGAKIKGCKMI